MDVFAAMDIIAAPNAATSIKNDKKPDAAQRSRRLAQRPPCSINRINRE